MIDQTAGDTLIVRGVSARDFDEIDRQRRNSRRKFRLRRFVANSKMLIITIPTELHEKLHTWIYEEFNRNIGQMGLHRNWNTMGTATFRARGHPNGDGEKEIRLVVRRINEVLKTVGQLWLSKPETQKP